MSHPPLHSPAAERNKQPILEALLGLLPAQGRALEIAAGTGQHGPHFMAGLPGWSWQATDLDTSRLEAIAAWAEQAPAEVRARLPAPLRLDVLAEPWPLDGQRYELVFCANMLHVAPWPCCAALMRGAARHLVPTGLLLTYGPYLEAEVPTAASNLAFDADIRARDAAWGLRSLEAVRAEAAAAGLSLRQRIAMPANNLLLVWALTDTCPP
ncbi:DUF938 domain-containing protein [Paucibacter soli]|uniref:DUF938 domain-containing protein n=1 Tax=Paucibacter soli TaxID=3133433 RepID=UPI0030AB795C